MLTLKSDPDNVSSTWNNLPSVPSTENTPDPLPLKEAATEEPDCTKDPVNDRVEPSNCRLASPLKGVAPFPVAVTT